MPSSPILYKYALDARGKPRHIKNPNSVPPYKCGDCRGEMIAKRGRIRQWHYAHKANVICTPKADPDNALHRYAQEIILEAFNRCKEDGSEYLLGVKCAGFRTGHCTGHVAKNIALPNSEIRSEASIVPHTRSDLVLINPDHSNVILELVNTHPLDADTKESYLRSNIPVCTLKLTWDTLSELSTSFIADECLNIGPAFCDLCVKRKEHYQTMQNISDPYLEEEVWPTWQKRNSESEAERQQIQNEESEAWRRLNDDLRRAKERHGPNQND